MRAYNVQMVEPIYLSELIDQVGAVLLGVI